MGERSNVTEKQMFDNIAFMLPTGVFVGVIQEDLMARVGLAGYERAVNKAHVREMDFVGHPGAVEMDVSSTARL